jgi:proteasome lid subunit RPN8/RPN11
MHKLASCAALSKALTFSYMQSGKLSSVKHLIVPPTLVERTLEVLQRFGNRNLEGLVLWVGSINEDTAVVMEVHVPDQNSVSTEEGVGYFVTGETLFALNRDLSDRGLRLIAQVHSHPNEAYHSTADDEYAIVTTEGGFSFVVPDFGVAPANPRLWALYRLINGEWIELDEDEAAEIIVRGNA